MKERRILLVSFFVSLAFLFSVQVVFAGLIIERVHRIDAPGHAAGSDKQVSFFQANKVKTVSGDGSYAILDMGKGIMIMVDPGKKEYSVTSLKEMVSTMEQGMKQLQDRFNALPPEQRAMVEKMMGIQKAAPGSLKLKDTGETAKIAGYLAKKYVILKNGKPLSEYWVSKALRQDILHEIDKSKIKDFENAMNKISMEGMPFGSSEAKEIVKLEQKVQEYGEVVKELHYPHAANMNRSDSFQVVSVKKANIPRSEFQVPAGYKKMESPMKRLKAASAKFGQK